MADGGNGFFMFDPFIDVGLAPLMADYGVHLDETMVIDPGHHFAAAPSSYDGASRIFTNRVSSIEDRP